MPHDFSSSRRDVLHRHLVHVQSAGDNHSKPWQHAVETESEELSSQAELLITVRQLKNILLPLWQSWGWCCPVRRGQNRNQSLQRVTSDGTHSNEQILLLSSGTLLTVFGQQLKSLFPAITHPASYVSSACWQKIQSEEAANTKYRCIPELVIRWC